MSLLKYSVFAAILIFCFQFTGIKLGSEYGVLLTANIIFIFTILEERFTETFTRVEKWFKRKFKRTDLKKRVYKSRSFPPKLRYAIFKRDKYKCQSCGIHADNLPKKVNLEIDHIVSYSKGGKTTYSNGQTLCSNCNKGKYHAERK